MKAKFEIRYNTRWGESLTLNIGDNHYPMNWNEGAIWTVEAQTGDAEEFSFSVMRDGLIVRDEWEPHRLDRRKKLHSAAWNDCPIPGCRFTRSHRAAQFDRPGYRAAGCVIPVFSLRSRDDFGIGEFTDLIPLVDWAASTGQAVIQLLPVTDTTRSGDWQDSYPYSPVSGFALHPLYLSLEELGIKHTAAYLKEKEELNALPEIDYPRVFKAKMERIRELFRQRGEDDLRSGAFALFRDENAAWLDDYCSFCARRGSDKEPFHAWIQFHLDRQFAQVARYARGKGIALKGDLPIGVSADSADAWKHPELFNLDSTAGAPPDFFSAEGQNWGFPTYNWEEMEKDGYLWWRERLRGMARYFDAFRIDHILGFFRIWEIPVGKTGGRDGHFNPALPYTRDELEAAGLPVGERLFHEDPRHPGFYQPLISPDTAALDEELRKRFDVLYNDFFFHRHEDFWRRNALKKFPSLLSATGMLACGEDLGMVPSCVGPVMEEQRILSLEMGCMDKGRPWPELSVCATSSHDMATLRMQMKAASGHDPYAGEVGSVLWNHLNSPSMLAIFPLQDWLALDEGLRRSDADAERINEPADPAHHWRFRLHLDVNKLREAEYLNSMIRSLLERSGRFQG